MQTTPRWSSSTKLTVVLLLLALSAYLLYRFSAVLKPLILALLIAYVLNPIASWLEERLRLRRSLATLFTYLLMFIFLGSIPLLFLPPLVAQAARLNLDLQDFVQQVEAALGNQYTLLGQTIDVDALLQEALGSIRQLVEPVVGQTFGFLIEAISSLVWVIFIIIVSFYLVKDGQALQRWLEELVPSAYQEDFLRLRSEINLIWQAFFRGQLVLALIVTLIFTAVGLIIGMPFALTMAVIAGLLEFLPSIGHGIWLTMACILTLFTGSTWLKIPNWAFMLLVIGLHIIFQQFDLNYLIPRIIGRRVHLPPLVVILGIVSGALLAGVLGILLAAPTIASVRVIGRYLYAQLFDKDPFPTPIAPSLPPPNPRWWRKQACHAEKPITEITRENE